MAKKKKTPERENLLWQLPARRQRPALTSEEVLSAAAKALVQRWQMPAPTARAIARAVLIVAEEVRGK